MKKKKLKKGDIVVTLEHKKGNFMMAVSNWDEENYKVSGNTLGVWIVLGMVRRGGKNWYTYTEFFNYVFGLENGIWQGGLDKAVQVVGNIKPLRKQKNTIWKGSW